MKKIILILTIINTTLFAQTGINYQGAATDADGTKLVNQNISLKTSVLQGVVDGTTSYSEIHNTTTDQFGLFNVVIGQGVSISGDFETISWGSDDHFLKVELDATGGTNYNLVSTTQMMSVPYALYAKNAGLDSVAVADMLTSMNISGNSGYCDFKFPDGLMGDPITYYLNTAPNGTYTVEAGKNLYITNLYTEQYHKIRIDGIIITEALFNMTAGNNLFGNTLANPLILKENQTISIDGGFGAFNGFLVPPKVEPVTHYLSSSSNDSYTVEDGKNLYITNLYTEQYYKIKIDGIIITEALFNMTAGQNKFGNTLSLPLIVKPGQTITLNGGFGSFNGYLVDEDFFADCGGSGGSSSSTPSSIDSAMVADMIAANTSSGSGGDWELLYDELNTNNDEPYGTVNRYGIAQSDGFLYLVGSYATVYTGNDHDTITNTWPENPILQNISANDPNEAHIIPLKKNMSWHIEFHSTLGYITKGYFIPNGGGSASLANGGMSGTSKSFKYPDGMHGTPITIAVGTDNSYTVPEGKNLYANYFRPSSGGNLYVDGVRVAISYNNLTTENGSDLLYVGEGQTITCDNNLDINEMSTLNGFLTDKSVDMVSFGIGGDLNNYTVPIGKNLYVNYFRPSSGGSLYIDGIRVATSYNNFTTNKGSDLLYVGEGQTITCDNNLDINEMSTLNGYLADLDYFESSSSSSASNSEGGGSNFLPSGGAPGSVLIIDEDGNPAWSNTYLEIGDNYGGGIIAYIFQSGDPGYIEGETHGYIINEELATNLNPEEGAMGWGCDNTSTNVNDSEIGQGFFNTQLIAAQCPTGTGGVWTGTTSHAKFWNDLEDNGYDDWFLPNSSEVMKLNSSLMNVLNFNNFYISEESTTNPSSEALVAHRNDWGIYTFDSSSKAAGYDSIGIREF